MAEKENRGGNLSNQQVEEDNRVKGKSEGARTYIGSQDTGDSVVRERGTEVQQQDGNPPDHLKEEE